MSRAAAAALTRRRWCGAGAGLMALCLCGCAASKLARGVPGTDLRGIRPGSTRADVEALLGPPARRWTSSAGVEYRLYRYDGGIPGSAADSATFGFFDVISLGLWELFAATDPTFEASPDSPQRARNLAVSYDAAGIVLGVFPDVGDFAELPADGRAPPAR